MYLQWQYILCKPYSARTVSTLIIIHYILQPSTLFCLVHISYYIDICIVRELYIMFYPIVLCRVFLIGYIIPLIMTKHRLLN